MLALGQSFTIKAGNQIAPYLPNPARHIGPAAAAPRDFFGQLAANAVDARTPMPEPSSGPWCSKSFRNAFAVVPALEAATRAAAQARGSPSGFARPVSGNEAEPIRG
jgi:hypothetical protein